MTMPEASIYKHYRLIFLQHDVRFTWQASHIQSVTKPVGKEVSPNPHLRFGIATFDGSHTFTPLFFRQLVHFPTKLVFLRNFLLIVQTKDKE